MASYAEFDGVPIHISREILTTLLRGRLGFTGTVVSDYVGVGWAQTRQRVAADAEEVGSLALAAGMDVELPSIHGYGPALVNAVESKKVSESMLDESVRRVLRDKFALGLFDDPYVPEAPSRSGRSQAKATNCPGDPTHTHRARPTGDGLRLTGQGSDPHPDAGPVSLGGVRPSPARLLGPAGRAAAGSRFILSLIAFTDDRPAAYMAVPMAVQRGTGWPSRCLECHLRHAATRLR
jgi:hypothetical protein